jgi:hypothetical protein
MTEPIDTINYALQEALQMGFNSGWSEGFTTGVSVGILFAVSLHAGLTIAAPAMGNLWRKARTKWKSK